MFLRRNLLSSVICSPRKKRAPEQDHNPRVPSRHSEDPTCISTSMVRCGSPQLIELASATANDYLPTLAGEDIRCAVIMASFTTPAWYPASEYISMPTLPNTCEGIRLTPACGHAKHRESERIAFETGRVTTSPRASAYIEVRYAPSSCNKWTSEYGRSCQRRLPADSGVRRDKSHNSRKRSARARERSVSLSINSLCALALIVAADVVRDYRRAFRLMPHIC